MAEVLTRTEYRLTLSQEEMRLVGLALSGKLKGRKDMLAAMELNVKLLDVKERFLVDLANVTTGSVDKARKELEEMRAEFKAKPEDPRADTQPGE